MTSLKEYSMASTSFYHSSATQKLKKLALAPQDLTQGKLTLERIFSYVLDCCGYKLLYGTEQVNDEIIQALKELAEETQAIKKMENMQNGEKVNCIEGYPSENRPALHTATRDFFDLPNKAKEASEAALFCKQEITKLKNFIQKIGQENKFQELISIGIGGSDLGPKAHYLALEHLLLPNRKVHFISNVDPDNLAMVLGSANLSQSLVLINSKSGTTLETATNEAIARKAFKDAGLDPKEHFISASMPGSLLDNKQNYLECFYIKDWVGGRFSTTSPVGGIILSFAFGFDIFWELLRGANQMDKAALQSDPAKNMPLFGALLGIWNRNFLNHPNLAIIPYSQALGRFSAHLQQLDMESNGKHIDNKGNKVAFNTGPIIFGEPGTSAQHSFFQLLHQGTTVVPIEFIGFKKDQTGKDVSINGTTSQDKLLANMFAQSIALATGKNDTNPNKVFPGNRPSHILLANQLTPFSLGVLLAYYEHKIAYQGFIWGINSFDQEGVQLGKELATELLTHMAAKNQGQAIPPSSKNAGDAYMDILNTL